MKKFLISILLMAIFQRTALAQQSAVSEFTKASNLIEIGEKIQENNKDSAYYCFNQAYKIYKANENWSRCIEVLQQIGYTNGFHYELEKYRKTIDRIDSIFGKYPVYFDSISNGQSLRNYQLIDKANYYNKIKNYKKSKCFAVELAEIIKSIPEEQRSIDDIENLCIAYEFEALALANEGRFIESEILYKKSLHLILEKLNENFAYPTYRLLGDLYGRQRKYIKSNSYLKKGLDYEISDGKNAKNKIVKSCYAIADNYIKMNLSDSARYYLTIANKQLSSSDLSLRSQYYEILGELEFLQGNVDLSIKNSNKALEFLKSEKSELQRADIARIHRLRGTFLFGIEDYQKSLKNFDTALEWLTQNLKPNDSANILSLDRIYYKYEYLKILKEKIKTQIKLNDYINAHQTALMAIRIIDDLKPSFQDEEDKQFLIENFYPVFEHGLLAVYNLYKSSGNKGYVDQAFHLIEKSKAIILLEALMDAQAYEFSQIPDHLIEKEKQLSSTLNELQTKLYDDKSNASLNDKYFETREAYKEFVKYLEIQYPDYYRLKYDTNVTGIKDFQNSLEDKTLAISYFMEGDFVFAIGITKEKKELIKISSENDLEEQILSFKKSLENHSSNPVVLKKKSIELYNQLLAPFVKNNSFDKLLIFPSGSLNHIPFEVLRDRSKYVIESMTVNSANSATLLQFLNQKKYKDNNLIAFAPSFFGRYIPLKSSQNKVRDIVSKYKGILFEGKDATLTAFNKNSSEYGIIHLATHGNLDDKNPGRSHLVFAAKNGIDSLRVSDIYVKDINASLVFLSACQTDLGQLKKGEGMISLSRAFFYAGALSLASSKWQVDDASSSEIIGDFYTYLDQGRTKDKALQLSKLDFLKKHKNERDYLHPYWWSGITISGNMSPIKNHNINWYWLFLVFLIAPIVVWVAQKKK